MYEQTAMAFRTIQGSLSLIVSQIRTLASLASEVDRLHFLLVCMEGVQAQQQQQPGSGGDGDGDDVAVVAAAAMNDGYVAVPQSDQPAEVVKDDLGGGDAVGEEGVLLSLGAGTDSNDGLDVAAGVGGEGQGGRITTVVMGSGLAAGDQGKGEEGHVTLKT